MEGLVTMSNKELDRMLVLDRVLARALTQQRAAAEMLGLSDRQIRRMLRAYEVSGAPALASKRRASPATASFLRTCARPPSSSSARATRTLVRRSRLRSSPTSTACVSR
jgi:hypothetical protein